MRPLLGHVARFVLNIAIMARQQCSGILLSCWGCRDPCGRLRCGVCMHVDSHKDVYSNEGRRRCRKKDEEEIDPEQMRKDMERLQMQKQKRCRLQLPSARSYRVLKRTCWSDTPCLDAERTTGYGASGKRAGIAMRPRLTPTGGASPELGWGWPGLRHLLTRLHAQA